MDRGQVQSAVVGEPGDPLDAEQVGRTVRVGPAQERRHRVRERSVRSRRYPDLGRQVGIGDQRDHRALGELEALGDGRHGGGDGRGIEVADGRCHARSVDARYDAAMAPIDTATSLENLKLERDAIVLYDALARIEKDPRRAAAFERIADNERRHAEIWATKLTELGADVPPPAGPRPRVRFIILAARLFGTRAVSDLVKALEGDEEAIYDAQGAGPGGRGDRRRRARARRIWDQLERDRQRRRGASRPRARTGSRSRRQRHVGGRRSPSGSAGTAAAAARARCARSSSASPTASSATCRSSWASPARPRATRASSCSPGSPACSPGRSPWPRASTSRCRASASCSSARSPSSAPSWRRCPRRRRPSSPPSTGPRASRPTRPSAIAARIFEDPKAALDTLVREELGLDPDELGSPWGAAFGSFVAFAIGAVIPVIPFLFGSGDGRLAASLGLSLVALFVVGAGVSLLTGRSLLFSGFRQMGIGSAPRSSRT